MRDSKGRFIKGSKPHNAGKVGLVNNGGFKVGHKQLNTGRTYWKREDVVKKEFIENRNKYLKSGEDNWIWKGNDVSYVGLHMWVRRHNGKPTQCEFCNSKTNIQWANKSHEYKRDLEDWLQLCVPCHKIYDKGRSDRKLRYGKQI